MSLEACIDELVTDGKMTKEQGERARLVYGEARARHSQSMGPAAADAMASEDALKALSFEAAERKRVQLLQIDAQQRALSDMASFDGGSGKHPGQAAMALLDHSGKAPYKDGNVAVQKQAIVARAHALMQSVLETFDRDIAGRMRNPAQMADVMRELFGQHTGNEAAKEMAAAWTEAAEMLRQRFNAAGGNIGKIEHWGLPQAHDGIRIRDAGFNDWRDFITPKLDRLRMQDRSTGLPFTDDAMERSLKSVYDTITTDGWISREPGGQSGTGKLSSTRAEQRFLIFKGGDEWSAYHQKFGGGGSEFDAMVGHIDDMARDIAHMERLGPNPSATVKWLQDGIKKDAAMTGRRDKLTSSASGDVHQLQKLYDITSGRSGIPANAKWARGLSGARSLITAAKLGGAVFSAVSDTGFQMMTRHFNGLPAWSAVTDHLKLMTSGEHRDAAVRLGLIAEESARQAAGVDRYMGESIGPGITSRLADATLRLSGLSAWTQTGKWAYGIGQLSHLTDSAGRDFGALDGAARDSLERYGIDSKDWDAIRQSDRLTVKGANFINPTKIADQDVGDRLLRLLATETAFAVPEVTARARALTSFGQSGTFAGEAGRSLMQFKSFSAAMLLTHGARAMSMSPYNRAKYVAGLFVTTTMLGALALQSKEIVKGKGLRPMDDWRFWKDAALQGGGLGIFGDFIGSQVFQQLDKQAGINRAGSLPEAIAGPLVGAASDAIDLGIVEPARDAMAAYNGQQTGHTAKAAIHAVKGYTPLVTLWPIRTALERMVIDQMQAQIDPTYQQSWAKMEQRAAAGGQSYYWHPGELAPSSAPDLNAAMTAPPVQ